MEKYFVFDHKNRNSIFCNTLEDARTAIKDTLCSETIVISSYANAEIPTVSDRFIVVKGEEIEVKISTKIELENK